MDPQKQAIIDALMMRGKGPMDPMLAYQNAIRNSEGGPHWARERFEAGHPVATDPMPTREQIGMSPLRQRQAIAGMAQDYAGAKAANADRLAAMPAPHWSQASGNPEMTGGAPFNPREAVSVDPLQAFLQSLGPQEQQGIMALVQQGMSPDDAIAQVLGIDMNAITRGQ